MTLEQALATRLAAYAGLTALVSARIYPLRLAQSPTLPAVTYQRISTVPVQALSASASVMIRTRLQVTSWATTYAGVQLVAAQVRACLDGFAGMLGGAGGVNCTLTWLNQVDLIDPEENWYYIACDFEAWE
jgi:hypothetical protein